MTAQSLLLGIHLINFVAIVINGKIFGMEDASEHRLMINNNARIADLSFGQKDIDINKEAKAVANDRLNRALLRLTLLTIFVQAIFIIVKYNQLPTQVPLFYSLPWGEKRLAYFKLLFLLPVFSLGILLINHIISSKIYNKERLLSRVSLAVALTSSLLSLITLTQILLVIS